ncbi:MAG: diguanylate cyclase [Anaerolineaceae bacterium]|nr:diguanylate cyclase [Anaerolineaceae bacterium]
MQIINFRYAMILILPLVISAVFFNRWIWLTVLGLAVITGLIMISIVPNSNIALEFLIFSIVIMGTINEIVYRLVARRKYSISLQESFQLISEFALSMDSLDEFFAKIHETLKVLLPAKNFYIAIYQEENNTISLAYVADEYFDETNMQKWVQMPLRRGLTNSLIQKNAPLHINLEKYQEMLSSGEIDAIGYPAIDWLGVPLKTKNADMIGALVVQSYDPKQKYNNQDLKTLLFVSTQIAMAIERKQAEQQLKENLEREKHLNEISHLISSMLDQDQIYEDIIQHSVELLDGNSGLLSLISEDQQFLCPKSIYNLPDRLKNQYFSKAELIYGWQAVQNNQTIQMQNYHEKPDANPRLVKIGVRSFLISPILSKGTTLGVLAIFSKNPERIFNERDVELAVAITKQAGTAILNTRLFEAQEKRAVEAETLRIAGAAVASTLNQQDMIDQVLQQLAKVVPYDSASVQIRRGNKLVIVGGHGFDDLDSILGYQFNIDESILDQQLVESRKPLIIPDMQILFSDNDAPREKIRSWMGVPLIVHDELVGILTLDAFEADRFNEEYARLASAFANEVAIALKNSILYEEVKRMAIMDGLTNVFNRGHLFSLAKQEFERSLRYDSVFTIIMIDLDRFKLINDTFGHVIGDMVLRKTAEICQQTLRNVDILGRYGGEEFLVILPETSQEEGLNIAERLRVNIANHIFQSIQGPIIITASFGLASFVHKEILKLEELIDRADQALYISKQSGRNKVNVWVPTKQEQSPFPPIDN